MIINLTFFVQIINFWIGYIIVRYLIFKPILDLIVRERYQYSLLQEKILEAKKNLSQKDIYSQNLWRDLSFDNIVLLEKTTIKVPDVEILEQDICPKKVIEKIASLLQSNKLEGRS